MAVIRAISACLGISGDHAKGALQLCVGMAVLLAAVSTPAAWQALSLPSAALTPVYAIVTLVVCLQPLMGAAAQFVLMRAAGAVVGGLCGLVAMYTAYAANGGSYDESLTKAAVTAALLAAFALVLGFLRFHYQQYWFFFVVAVFSAPMVALNPYWQTSYVDYQALFYWWLQIALGICTAALASMFVLPVTAASKVRAKTRDNLRQLGELTRDIVDSLVTLPLAPDGRPDAAAGGIDAGITNKLTDMGAGVSASIESVRHLLTLVPVEWDPYQPSQQHTFPRESFELIQYILRAYLSSTAPLMFELHSGGRLSLAGVQSHRDALQAAAGSLEEALCQLAGCLDGTVKYGSALQALQHVERQWRALGGLSAPLPHNSIEESSSLAMDTLLAVLFNLATRVRRLYFALPNAIAKQQPNARELCRRHFKGSGVWDLTSPQESLKQRALLRAATPTTAVLSSVLPSPRSPHPAKVPGARLPGAPTDQFPAVIPLPLPPARWAGAALVAKLSGSTLEHALLALQLAMAVAVATVLHVNEHTYEALGGRTIWIIVTVVVILEPSFGSLVLKSGLRAAGTAMAGLLGVGLMGFAYLVNGLSYDNRPPKFVAMTILLPLVCGLIMVLHQRFLHPYGYMWSVCKLTTPIIALVGYASTEAQWRTAAWRLANIAIGIVIDLVVSLLIPVTTRRVLRNRVQEGLGHLAILSESVILQFVQPPACMAQALVCTPRSPLLSADDEFTFRTAVAVARSSTAAGGGTASSAATPLASAGASPDGPCLLPLGASPGAAEQPNLAAAAGATPTAMSGRLPVVSLRATVMGSPLALSPQASPLRTSSAASERRGTPPPALALGRRLATARPGSADAPAREPTVKWHAEAVSPRQLPQPGSLAGGCTELTTLRRANSTGSRRQGSVKLRAWEAAPSSTGVAEPAAEGAASTGAASAAPSSLGDPRQWQETELHATVDVPTFALPPLNIPPHHEDGDASPGYAAATPLIDNGRGPPSSDAEAGGRLAGESTAAAAARLERTTSDSTASSSLFWVGTPRDRSLRRQRSTWLQRRALGLPFLSVRDTSGALVRLVSDISGLVQAGHFELRPVPAADIRAAARGLRRMQSVLLSFAYLADSAEVPHLRLLQQFETEVRALVAQLAASLRAVSELVSGAVSLDRVLAMAGNLQLQVQLLLLAVEEVDGMSEADTVLGLAALGVLFAACQTVQLLLQACIKLFGSADQLRRVTEAFEGTAAWAASLEARLMAQGVVLSSLCTDTTEHDEARGGDEALASAQQAAA